MVMVVHWYDVSIAEVIWGFVSVNSDFNSCLTTMPKINDNQFLTRHC